MLSFFPRDVLDENWDLIESVFVGFFYLLLNFCAIRFTTNYSKKVKSVEVKVFHILCAK